MKIDLIDTLIISIVVLYIGHVLTRHIRFLQTYSIPQAVTGGLLISLAVLVVEIFDGPEIVFDLRLRDLCLLAFFSTVGLSAKFGRLKTGGKPLVILLACASVFLLVQNTTGVLIAQMLGSHPAYGLFAGSISFAGGHGTAIAWGQEAEAAGLTNAPVFGIAFATFGLIAGGLVGGPIAEFFIKRHNLQPDGSQADQPMMADDDSTSSPEPVSGERIYTTIIILAVCISLGDVVNRVFFDVGAKLPGFLTSMMVRPTSTRWAAWRCSFFSP